MATSGVYQIYHSGAEVKYIGSSVDVHRRISEHAVMLQTGSHHAWRFQEAWNRSGGNGWAWEILEEAPEESLGATEQFWINQADRDDLLNTRLTVAREPRAFRQQSRPMAAWEKWALAGGFLLFLIYVLS